MNGSFFLRAAASVAFVMLVAACQSSPPRPANDAGTQPPAERQPSPASATERARAHTELAASYLNIGRLAVALQEADEALKADPRYVPAHNIVALVYMELREDVKAKASFERALKLKPGDSDVNNSYGLFLCDRKKEKDSIRYFEAALRNPLYASPHDAAVNAGICSRRIGDEVGALQYFERALAFRPDDARALVNLAQLHHARRQVNLAKSYLTRFMQGTQKPDAATLWLGARLEHALGDRAAVASYGSQLKERFPTAPETQLFLDGRFE